MFPTAKLMVRWKGTRLALGLLLATGFVIHVFRYFMPAHYLHLVGGKADLSWNIRYLWSDDNFVIALHGLVPPLVCWFEYLWMRRSPVTKPAVPNP